MLPVPRKLVSRRKFLTVSAVSLAGIGLPGRLLGQKKERPPQIDPDLVHEFVRVAHGDLEAVKTMLAGEPELLNATWDWGGGDFEAAIGGAGHMGRRDIALYLLDHGARLNIFVAAMLGWQGVVESALDAMPGLLHAPGPHGIPLVRHAEAGGEEAKQVLDYLQRLGA